MIRSRFCDLFGIAHPVVLGGMGSVFSPELVAAVSEAGGLGTLGCNGLAPDRIRTGVATIRQRTQKPFALNFVLFLTGEEGFAAALAQRPAAISLAWPRGDQNLRPYIERAHAAGARVTFMASDVAGAKHGAAAGADAIIAQGVEGGGHVGWMASSVFTPMVVDAVAPVPVLAAGGIADGRGLAAALALGAEGALLGTRFLACAESSLHENFKRAIVESDGHDTMLTEIPDIAASQVWPGAMARARRNRFIDRWAGREWALRQNAGPAAAAIQSARVAGDSEEAPLLFGQDAGLIHEILPATEIVRRIVADAERILSERLPGLVAAPRHAGVA